ncbi:MAG TPA: cellulose binding domain-containing protein [Bacillota bacterium]|jgi:hypothetical protein|nr:sugar-binding protein [Fastidiosipila sp.]HPX93706.1 cellulose binding domain-containing protein [Bacillota bacterium]HQB81454.1 cellulose binding domain-containing protein [Bacillota bacterium]
MKKLITISILVLAIVTSLLAGTMAYYTTQVDIAAGSVTAKEFIFLSEEIQSFTVNEKIAPSESVQWSFRIMNYEDSLVTETRQYYKLIFDAGAAKGKLAIDPLVIRIKDMKGKLLGSIEGTGSFEYLGEFDHNPKKQSREFTVEMVWPADGTNDSAYAGSQFGTAVKVSGIASQAPFDGSGQPDEPAGPQEPEDPQKPEKPEESDYAKGIKIDYSTGNSWGKYQYTIKIRNLSDEVIEDWKLSFVLQQKIHQEPWNAKIAELDGSYVFTRPASDFNVSIQPGGEITFAGQFVGDSIMTPTHFRFKDKPVSEDDLTISLGSDKTWQD